MFHKNNWEEAIPTKKKTYGITQKKWRDRLIHTEWPLHSIKYTMDQAKTIEILPQIFMNNSV